MIKRLWEIEKGSKIYVDISDKSKFVIFKHLDGAYSYCETENGGVLHLSGGTPLQKIKDGYKIFSS